MLRSKKLERLTAMSVSALLAANALVLAIGLGDELTEPEAPTTITYIVGENGERIAVDPTTPEGWRAIAEAQERGDEIITEPAGGSTGANRPTTTTTTTRPRAGAPVAPAGGGVELPDVEGIVDDTLTTVVETVGQVGETVDDVTDIIDDTTGLDTGETVDPVVDETTDTLTTTVSTVAEQVTDQTLPPVTAPPVTVPPVTVPPVVAGAVEEVAPPVTQALPGLGG